MILNFHTFDKNEIRSKIQKAFQMWSEHILLDFDEEISTTSNQDEIDIRIKFVSENFHTNKHNDTCYFGGNSNFFFLLRLIFF